MLRTAYLSLVVLFITGADGGCGLGEESDGESDEGGARPECQAHSDCELYESCFDGACEPAYVAFTLTDAVIGPGKLDNSPWDGTGTLDEAVWDALEQALSAATPYGAYAAAVGVLADLANQGFDAPDPLGYAELGTDGIWGDPVPVWDAATNYEDTFVMPFPPDFGAVVPLTESLRIRVYLEDEDLVNNDPIGTVELSADDVLRGIEASEVLPVLVADQSHHQILFVSLSAVRVRAE